jgi:hypothetical protein
LLAYIGKKKVTGVSGKAPKIFLDQDVRCEMKEVKEDAYKVEMKRKGSWKTGDKSYRTTKNYEYQDV